MKRYSTKYPGVFYREADRIGKPGKERVYYVVFKRDDKLIEEKAGRQYADDMTPAKAATLRGELIEGKRPLKRDVRKKKTEKVWTITELWNEYKKTHSKNKGLDAEDNKFKKNIKDLVGRKKPEDLKSEDIEKLKDKLEGAGRFTTAVRCLELIRRTINFGVDTGRIQPLPFRIKIPSLNNQVTEDLSLDQMKKLINALDEDEDQLASNLIRLALFTGMRRGELLKLKWSDIDEDKGFIHIRDPKGGTDETIPLSKTARAVFENIPKDQEHVFPGKKKGMHAVDMKKSIARIKDNADLPKGFRPLHGLRHVFASMLASSGQVDLYTLQRLLTHKSPLMTQRYAHLRDEALKRGADMAGQIINDIQKNATSGGDTRAEEKKG